MFYNMVFFCCKRNKNHARYLLTKANIRDTMRSNIDKVTILYAEIMTFRKANEKGEFSYDRNGV